MIRRDALVAAAAVALVASSEPDPVEANEALEEPIASPEEAPKIAALEEETRAVAAWVEQNRGALPTDYDELARLPSAHRIGVFLALSPEHASAVMQEHLRRSVASCPRMPAAQRDAIARAQHLFTPAWYAGKDEMRGAVWRGPFGQRLDDVFSLEEKIRFFATIGPEDDGMRARIDDSPGR